MVVADVGKFDRHEKLLQDVGAIPTWIALAPTCGKPVQEWTVLAGGVMDGVKAADVANLLAEARAAGTPAVAP